mmetsp:Transcript_87168/g.222062  ORF Transcript_87168/g.222062 Transcript_87168/m.222062 type:complete len:399 (-) Transcript_87168:294-1490(-)
MRPEAREASRDGAEVRPGCGQPRHGKHLGAPHLRTQRVEDGRGRQLAGGGAGALAHLLKHGLEPHEVQPQRLRQRKQAVRGELSVRGKSNSSSSPQPWPNMPSFAQGHHQQARQLCTWSGISRVRQVRQQREQVPLAHPAKVDMRLEKAGDGLLRQLHWRGRRGRLEELIPEVRGHLRPRRQGIQRGNAQVRRPVVAGRRAKVCLFLGHDASALIQPQPHSRKQGRGVQSQRCVGQDNLGQLAPVQHLDGVGSAERQRRSIEQTHIPRSKVGVGSDDSCRLLRRQRLSHQPPTEEPREVFHDRLVQHAGLPIRGQQQASSLVAQSPAVGLDGVLHGPRESLQELLVLEAQARHGPSQLANLGRRVGAQLHGGVRSEAAQALRRGNVALPLKSGVCQGG